MEQASPANESRSPSREIIEAQIRDCFARVVYSHKTHEKCADLLLDRMGKVKLWQIVLSAVVSAGFIAAVFGTNKTATIIGLIVSVVLLSLNSYMKSYDFGQLAAKHRETASYLWLVREKYLSLLTDLTMSSIAIDQIQQRRDALLAELHAIYKNAPSTNYGAYMKAQKALQRLGDLSFSEDEIDAFLPKELKRNKL